MAKEEKEKSDLSKQMDDAAKEAASELANVKTAKEVAAWMKKWYMKAGYKRLSRELMNHFKD